MQRKWGLSCCSTPVHAKTRTEKKKHNETTEDILKSYKVMQTVMWIPNPMKYDTNSCHKQSMKKIMPVKNNLNFITNSVKITEQQASRVLRVIHTIE